LTRPARTTSTWSITHSRPASAPTTHHASAALPSPTWRWTGRRVVNWREVGVEMVPVSAADRFARVLWCRNGVSMSRLRSPAAQLFLAHDRAPPASASTSAFLPHLTHSSSPRPHLQQYLIPTAYSASRDLRLPRVVYRTDGLRCGAGSGSAVRRARHDQPHGPRKLPASSSSFHRHPLQTRTVPVS
jgi:hypothetical protein